MKTKDFTTTIEVAQTQRQAFDAINNVRGWWSEDIKGPTWQLNDEFIFRSGEYHVSKQKLIEVVPDKKIVWRISDSSINFVKDKKEWEGTIITFDITTVGNKTIVRFTHEGLLPQLECYKACSGAWTGYVQKSLFNLITKGKGQPELIS